MFKNLFLLIGIVSICVGAAYGIESGTSSQTATTSSCRCCGDQCQCEDCVCDAMGCSCDTGGVCFCSEDCCKTCCGK